MLRRAGRCRALGGGSARARPPVGVEPRTGQVRAPVSVWARISTEQVADVPVSAAGRSGLVLLLPSAQLKLSDVDLC